MRHAACLLFALAAIAPAVRGAAMPPPVAATPQPVWRVEELKRGMKGTGRTVVRGTRIETFQAEILGVLRNGSPGRDLVLARLSGMDLDRTGVIAGMSGSPVYVDGKLVGAVAYAWPFGKEPIAGITPFVQMQSFAESAERREAKLNAAPKRIGLAAPLRVGGRTYDAVTVSEGPVSGKADDGLWLVPLRMPLAASGFTPHALKLLGKETAQFGLVPVQGGAVGKVADDEKDAPVEPGSPLSAALITGDFDLSGIGTTTHVEGNRVWGWGHPFMSLGGCQLPMYTGYIHTIYPRLTVSFKMGSPLKEVGVVNADVSTCIAGTLGKKADMMPLSAEVTLPSAEPRTFNVRVARHRTLLPSLVYAALTNATDMEGEMPEEVTARLEARVHLEGGKVLTIRDTFSGFSGGRAPAVLYTPVGNLVSQLTNNSFKELRIKKVECSTSIEPGRTSAEVESVEAESPTYCPGDTLRVAVVLRAYRGTRQRVTLEMKLPDDLPPGEHTAIICDEPSSARQDVRNHPGLLYPSSADQVLEAVGVLINCRRTTLAMRLPLGPHGVVTGGKALPTLPGSMVHILSNSKRTGTMTMARARVARRETPWVIQGSESVTFTVTKTRKVSRRDDE